MGALGHQCLCQPIPLHRGIVVAGPLAQQFAVFDVEECADQQGRGRIENRIDALRETGPEQGDVIVVEQGEARLDLFLVGGIAAAAAVRHQVFGEARLVADHEAAIPQCRGKCR